MKVREWVELFRLVDGASLILWWWFRASRRLRRWGQRHGGLTHPLGTTFSLLACRRLREGVHERYTGLAPKGRRW